MSALERRRGPARVLAVILLACVFAGPVAAQEPGSVRLAEAPATVPQERLQALIETGAFQLWVRDTVLGPDDIVDGPVLVLDATARIAGRVNGDVFVAGGDLFLRTGGRVDGDIVVLGGGFYGSDLAEVAGRTIYRPYEGLRAAPEDGGWVIYPAERDLRSWSLDGTRGFQTPVYQRVDALTFGWGGGLRAVRSPLRPSIEGAVRFKTGPGEVEGSVRGGIHPSDRLRIGLYADRSTRSQDRWIRRGWLNSIHTIVAGDDVRDYYRADRAGVDMRWRSPLQPGWRQAPSWAVTLGLGWESADSLVARDVTSLFGSGSARPNAAAERGDLYSVAAGFEYTTSDTLGPMLAGLGVEIAPGDPGAFSFVLAEARLVGHRRLSTATLEWYAMGRADLTGTLPEQRRSAVGGAGTLPVLPTLALRGDRLGYAELTLAYPILGADLGGIELFSRGALAALGGDVSSPSGVGSTQASGMAGVRARILDLMLELGASYGSSGASTRDLEVFFDLRMSRSHRPSMIYPRGRF